MYAYSYILLSVDCLIYTSKIKTLLQKHFFSTTILQNNRTCNCAGIEIKQAVIDSLLFSIITKLLNAQNIDKRMTFTRPNGFTF